MKQLSKILIKKDNLKRLANKRSIMLIVGAVVVLGIIGAAVYLVTIGSNKVTRADCTALISKASGQISQKKYQHAYSDLKTQAEKCGKPPKQDLSDLKDKSKTNQYIEVTVYNVNLARAAYDSGDKEQAKTYAKQAIKINEAMSPEQRRQIPNQNSALIDMYSIEAGIERPPIGDRQQ